MFVFGWLLLWIEDVGAMGQRSVDLIGGFGLTGSATKWDLASWR